jgi:hypothetical protein
VLAGLKALEDMGIDVDEVRQGEVG